MADPIRVLLVDDERDFTAMTAKYVGREHDDIEVATAASAAEGLDRLAGESFDCVVSDYEMPDVDGLTFLEQVRDAHPDLPFIMFTGRGDERVASRAIAAGVDDYLPKRTGTGQYAGLVDRIRRVVTRRDTETALERSEQRYRRLVRAAPVPVGIYTREGLVFVNDPAVEFLGADRESLVERSPAAVVDADDELAERLRAVLDDRTGFGPVEHRFTVGGRERVGRFSATPAFHGDDPAGQLVIDDVTEARRTADALQRERQVVDAVLSEARTVAYATDAEGRLQRWNDRLASVTGYSDAELAGMAVEKLVDPDDGDGEAVAPQGRDSGAATFEGHLVTRDGERAGFEFRETRLTDSRGSPDGRVGVGWHAGEEDDRLRAVKRQRDRLRSIVENVPVALFAFDPDGVLTLADGRGLAAFGIDPERDLGRSVFDVLADRGDLFEACERALGGEAGEATAAFDDRAFDAWFEPVTDEDGDLQRVIGTAIDITERRERELDLQRYRTVVEAAGDAMYAIDREGTMTMVNEAHTEFTGADREELLGSNVAEFMRPEDVRTGTEKIVELLKDDEKEAARFEIRDDEGDLYPGDEHTVYEDIIAVMTDDDGEYRGSVGVIRDITERKRRERQLRRQNERLDEFASVVAHDLRGPLTVAQGYVEMAAEEYDDENLREGMKSLQRMEHLLEDLLTLARQGTAVDETQSVLLEQVARDAWKSTDTAGATLELDDLGSVEADRSRLRQLFENLFRNAIDHVGGDVTVRVGPLDDRAGFFVADDGPGIPEDAREKVFEHGYTTSEDGTGFGLAIVKRIAGAHDWDVAATGSDSGGARFEVTGAVLRDPGEGSTAGTESGTGD